MALPISAPASGYVDHLVPVSAQAPDLLLLMILWIVLC